MSGKGIVTSELTGAQEELLKILESFMHGDKYHFPEGFTQVEE